ncbi:hypothetical protein KCP78_18620 [Salmonella enterica subsp. enterica]|nr:hypothetical protein KCP78_18620 [Salmonella enterica subsp. enterica]
MIRCTVLVLGEKGVNPLTRTSFIITEDLTPTISLAEDYCADWLLNLTGCGGVFYLPRLRHGA